MQKRRATSPKVEVYSAEGRQVKRIPLSDANVIVGCKFAQPRGRKGLAITLLVSVSVAALLTFIRLQRFKDRPRATGIDSKTHKKLPGFGNYKHMRNIEYSGPARLLTEDPSDDRLFADYDGLRATSMIQ
jgi:hypothetical protein